PLTSCAIQSRRKLRFWRSRRAYADSETELASCSGWGSILRKMPDRLCQRYTKPCIQPETPRMGTCEPLGVVSTLVWGILANDVKGFSHGYAHPAVEIHSYAVNC